MLEAKTENSSNESLFADEKPKANNRNNPALDRKGNSTRQSHADTWWLGPLIGDSQPNALRDSHIQLLTTIWIRVAHASVAISNPKVELESHADTCVVGDNCLVIHNYNWQVNAYSYDPKDGHRSAKTNVAPVGYHYPQSDQRLILTINQAICIDGLVNHLLCPLQCPLWCANQWSTHVLSQES